MSSNDALTRLGVWLYRLARVGQILTAVGALVVFVFLPLLVFGMIQHLPDGADLAAKTTKFWSSHRTQLLVLASFGPLAAVFDYRAFARLADIGWSLMDGEALSDRLADAWWRFAHAIAIAGAIRVLAPKETSTDPDDGWHLMELDFVPDFSDIHFYLITIICCYSIAIILREAAKAKREAVAAKQENEGFI